MGAWLLAVALLSICQSIRAAEQLVVGQVRERQVIELDTGARE